MNEYTVKDCVILFFALTVLPAIALMGLRLIGGAL